MSEEYEKEMTYNLILLNHINKLSSVTTSQSFDSIPKDQADKYINPYTSGEKSLVLGVHFLYCIIPDILKDKKFREEEETFNLEEKENKKAFLKLQALINLLARKGFLTTKKQSMKPITEIKEEEFLEDDY